MKGESEVVRSLSHSNVVAMVSRLQQMEVGEPDMYSASQLVYIYILYKLLCHYRKWNLRSDKSGVERLVTPTTPLPLLPPPHLAPTQYLIILTSAHVKYLLTRDLLNWWKGKLMISINTFLCHDLIPPHLGLLHVQAS